MRDRPADVSPPGRDCRRWTVLALLGTAFFMTILDGTSLMTALPSIRSHLGLSPEEVQWTVAIYGVVFGGVLLFCGRAADLLGRRRMFMIGLGLRAASSLASGVAWSAHVLVAARAAQGLSAAIIAAAALSLVITTYPEGPERNKALGVWGALGGIGATTGLLLGGAIAAGLGWRWIFFLNLPIALGVLALSPRVLTKDAGRDGSRRFDLAGALTITAVLLLLAYAIITIPMAGWRSVQTLCLLAGATGLLALFAYTERHTRAPLLPNAVLRSPGLIGGNLVLVAAGMSVDGMLITLTTFTQKVLGYSPIQFGLVATTMTATAVIGALAGQRLVSTVGGRSVGLLGLGLLGGACLVLTHVSSHSDTPATVVVGMIVFGLGMGATTAAAQITALSKVGQTVRRHRCRPDRHVLRARHRARRRDRHERRHRPHSIRDFRSPLGSNDCFGQRLSLGVRRYREFLLVRRDRPDAAQRRYQGHSQQPTG